MKPFKIVGLGPGHPDYLLPIAKRLIHEADHVIGGKRHLEAVAEAHHRQTELKGNYPQVVEMIKANEDEQVVVVVSGDTGFYSLAKYLGRFFDNDQYDCIPGISSMQYMFSKINGSWDHAYVGSVHGRDSDLESIVLSYPWIGLLTDKIMTPEKIANRIEDLGAFRYYIGENLSYENEQIYCLEQKEMEGLTVSDLNVLIIERI